jgi:hypothetical protein
MNLLVQTPRRLVGINTDLNGITDRVLTVIGALTKSMTHAETRRTRRRVS